MSGFVTNVVPKENQILPKMKMSKGASTHLRLSIFVNTPDVCLRQLSGLFAAPTSVPLDGDLII